MLFSNFLTIFQLQSIFLFVTAFRMDKPKQIQELQRLISKPKILFYPKDLNITKYTEVFSACLVHAINFQNRDIISSKDIFTPIMLSAYYVEKVKYKLELNKNKTEFETQGNIFQIEKQNLSQPIEFCHNILFENRCNDLPFLDQTSRTKPWICEVHLFLYPPTFEEDPSFYEWDQMPQNTYFFCYTRKFKKVYV